MIETTIQQPRARWAAIKLRDVLTEVTEQIVNLPASITIETIDSAIAYYFHLPPDQQVRILVAMTEAVNNRFDVNEWMDVIDRDYHDAPEWTKIVRGSA